MVFEDGRPFVPSFSTKHKQLSYLCSKGSTKTRSTDIDDVPLHRMEDVGSQKTIAEVHMGRSSSTRWKMIGSELRVLVGNRWS